MKIKNYTKISNSEIKNLIRLVRPTGISNFSVHIKNSRSWGGRCYWSGCAFSSSVTPLIICRVSPALKYPLNPNLRQSPGYLKHIKIFSYKEFIAYIIAHELRHLWQAKIKRGYRYYNCRGQFSERDADCYALHKLREYRRQVKG